MKGGKRLDVIHLAKMRLFNVGRMFIKLDRLSGKSVATVLLKDLKYSVSDKESACAPCHLKTKSS